MGKLGGCLGVESDMREKSERGHQGLAQFATLRGLVAVSAAQCGGGGGEDGVGWG